MSRLSELPAPGGGAAWHPDPLGSGRLRYFDGSAWTDHVADPVPAAPKQKKWWRPGWRKMTWALIIWSLLMLAWIIAGTASSDPTSYCESHPSRYLSLKSCEAAHDAGTGIGIGILIFLWFLGFVVLSLVWFMTRPKGRICPACGERVKKGRTTCQGCGHDFALAARSPAPAR